ncbi:MAG: nucleoside hydrolase [Bacteroidota bacterium]
MNKPLFFLIALAALGSLWSCGPALEGEAISKKQILLDTDANNELDDQHAIAYMLFSPAHFDVVGITVNATHNGGGIEEHMAEAERVVELCGKKGQIPIIPGASLDYEEILPSLTQSNFDGEEAVNFIIEEALKDTTEPLYLVPIGTLTNVALAIAKAPEIIPYVKIMWLGSNWPNAGEYNLENDTTSVNPLLNTPGLDLQICTVRYGEPSGTAAVTASVSEIRETMKGLGPQVPEVPGRHGGSFTCFGDYSIDLFVNIGDDKRALFDVCALAVLKNESWGRPVLVPAPELQGTGWKNRSQNARRVVFWENFSKDAILEDFYRVMQNAK